MNNVRITDEIEQWIDMSNGLRCNLTLFNTGSATRS